MSCHVIHEKIHTHIYKKYIYERFTRHIGYESFFVGRVTYVEGGSNIFMQKWCFIGFAPFEAISSAVSGLCPLCIRRLHGG